MGIFNVGRFATAESRCGWHAKHEIYRRILLILVYRVWLPCPWIRKDPGALLSLSTDVLGKLLSWLAKIDQ